MATVTEVLPDVVTTMTVAGTIALLPVDQVLLMITHHPCVPVAMMMVTVAITLHHLILI
jgi:hypothetical protein